MSENKKNKNFENSGSIEKDGCLITWNKKEKNFLVTNDSSSTYYWKIENNQEKLEEALHRYRQFVIAAILPYLTEQVTEKELKKEIEKLKNFDMKTGKNPQEEALFVYKSMLDINKNSVIDVGLKYPNKEQWRLLLEINFLDLSSAWCYRILCFMLDETPII